MSVCLEGQHKELAKHYKYLVIFLAERLLLVLTLFPYSQGPNTNKGFNCHHFLLYRQLDDHLPF